MTDHHLSNDEFLTRLRTLFSNTHSKNHGSVFLTQKPISIPSSAASKKTIKKDNNNGDDDTTTSEDATGDNELPQTQILIRATNGKSKPHRERAGDEGGKVKISTIVEDVAVGTGGMGGVEEFYTRYAEVCKKGMEGLRKRDRKGRKKKERGKKGGAAGAAGAAGTAAATGGQKGD